MIMGKKALLMILRAGVSGKHGKGECYLQYTNTLFRLFKCSLIALTLQASGENVGLPDGQMGNSEVGHLNIGAGRVVYQDLVKINKACENGDILKNKEIISAYSYAQKTGKKLHLMGLNFYGWRTFFAKPSAQINRNRQRIMA